MIEEPLLVVFIGWDVQSFLPLPFSRCLYQPCNALLSRGSLHTYLLEYYEELLESVQAN
jgi:hypothetical protein